MEKRSRTPRADTMTGTLTVRYEGTPSPAYLALWRLLLSPLPDEVPTPPAPIRRARSRKRPPAGKRAA